VKAEYTPGFGTNWTLSAETRYVYHGRLVVQERAASNTPTASYTRGVDLSGTMEGAGGIGGLLARSHGYSGGTGAWSTHHAYHADGGGNITALVASNQALSATYKYDPYGRSVSTSGSMAAANTQRFSSKEIVASTGFYYYGYRFYDPEHQRWLNRDPIEEAGGINLYAFNVNNALYWIDIDGRSSISHPASAAIAAEAEAAALGYPSYAAMQAAMKAAARNAALASAAALALSQSNCPPPNNQDPCQNFNALKNYLQQQHRDVLKGVSDVILKGGTQADLNKVPGLTPDLKAMIAAMYDQARLCYPNKNQTHNENRAKFVRGEIDVGPGGNKMPNLKQ